MIAGRVRSMDWSNYHCCFFHPIVHELNPTINIWLLSLNDGPSPTRMSSPVQYDTPSFTNHHHQINEQMADIYLNSPVKGQEIITWNKGRIQDTSKTTKQSEANHHLGDSDLVQLPRRLRTITDMGVVCHDLTHGWRISFAPSLVSFQSGVLESLNCPSYMYLWWFSSNLRWVGLGRMRRPTLLDIHSCKLFITRSLNYHSMIRLCIYSVS
jgi:hypothetical protein